MDRKKWGIEFFCPPGCIRETFGTNGPETPFPGGVLVRLSLSSGARVFHHVSLFEWARVIGSLLLDYGYVENEAQVAFLQVEKGVAEISGYSFRIEEV